METDEVKYFIELLFILYLFPRYFINSWLIYIII